jgi:MOSC domain-containing protein YiiM
MPSGTVVSINLSRGGVPKRPVPEARVGLEGLDGDEHRYRHHGGPRRAVCLYALERIEALRAEGHAIAPGAAGENLTVSGLAWDHLAPGAELRVGELHLLVTDYTTPCHKIAGCFTDGDSTRISQEHHPGWSRLYASVVAGGTVRVGDRVELILPLP